MPASPLSSASTQHLLDTYARAVARLSDATLAMKVQALAHQRSEDRLQQLQTDVIVLLYDAVAELQDATAPLIHALVPDTSGVRAAAGHAASPASHLTRRF